MQPHISCAGLRATIRMRWQLTSAANIQACALLPKLLGLSKRAAVQIVVM
jgi:hypothetical protein